MAKTPAKLTESDLLRRIKARSEYAWGYFLTQVGLEGRIADAVWFNPSHLRLIGFEVKCARGDWLKELQDPWKSYTVGKYCDEWYLVISKRDIVKPGELPEQWGLMVAHGWSTKILKRAPKNPEPKRWNRELVATLLKKVRPPHEPDALSTARQEGYREGYREGRNSAERSKDADHFKEKLDELVKKHEEFEEKTGVSISGWNMGRVAEDLMILNEVTSTGLRRQGERFAERCEATARTIRRTMDLAEENDTEPRVEPVSDNGMPGSLREIAGALLRYETTLRRSATTLDGLMALVDAPLPSIKEDTIHRAARIVEPVARLLGPEITVGLTRRLARSIQEYEDASEADERGHRELDQGSLPG